jgi:hypothetical protein
MKRKFLTSPFEIKEVSDDEEIGLIKGYASVFDNVDLGLDVVNKGAFKKTINDSKGKIPILADHNPYKQIGWNLKAEEDSRGLYVEGKLDIKNNQLARERFSLAKTAMEIGAKFGLSIGYMTIKEEPSTENPVIRNLKELKLFEYSFVTFPMNTEANVTGAKNFDYAVINDAEYAKSIAKLLELGKTKKEILLALEKAAAHSNNPSEQEAQLMLKNLERARQIFS